MTTARAPRRSPVLVAAALALAPAWFLGCDDTDDRRTRAILEVRGADSALADHGAAELQRLLEKSPRDRSSLYALAMHEQRRGHPIEAMHLLERIIDASPNSEEAALARDQLAAMASARAVASAQRAVAPPPLASIAILPGKGIAPVLVGAPAASASASLGPCELVTRGPDDVTTCHYFSRGVAVVLQRDAVKEVELLREHREVYDEGARHLYRGFVGQTPDGIGAGMPEASASAALGPPASRRLPQQSRIGNDGSMPVEVLDYPKKGISLEIDLTRAGRVVGAVGVPTLEGRERPTKKEDKP